MNFEFDFFGIDRLFSVPLEISQGSQDSKNSEASQPMGPDWIVVSLHNTRRSWLLLNLDRSKWVDDSAALELANIIAARKLADCDGLSLGTPQWMNDLQKRQLPHWLKLAVESGEGRWAASRLPGFRWHLVSESRSLGEQ